MSVQDDLPNEPKPSIDPLPSDNRTPLRTQVIESTETKDNIRDNVHKLIKQARQLKSLKKRGIVSRIVKSKSAKPPVRKPKATKQETRTDIGILGALDDDSGTDEPELNVPVDVQFDDKFASSAAGDITRDEDIQQFDSDEESVSAMELPASLTFSEDTSTILDAPVPEIVTTLPEYEHVVASSTPVERIDVASIDEGALDGTEVKPSVVLSPEQHQFFMDAASALYHEFKHNPALARIFVEYSPQLRSEKVRETATILSAWSSLITDIVRNSNVRLQQWVFDFGILLSNKLPNEDIAADMKMRFQQANFKYHIYSPEHLEPEVYDNISRFVSKLIKYLGDEPHKWKSDSEFVKNLTLIANRLFIFMDKKTAAVKKEITGIPNAMNLVDALKAYGSRSPYYILQIIVAGLDLLEYNRKNDVDDARKNILTRIYGYLVETFINPAERKAYIDYWKITVDDYYEILFDRLQILAETFDSMQEYTSDYKETLGITAGDIARIFGNQISEPARRALYQATKMSDAQEHSVWTLLTSIRKELYASTATIRKMNVRAKELEQLLREKETALHTLNQTRRGYAQLGTVVSIFFGSAVVRAKTDQFRRAMTMVSRQGIVGVYGMIIVRLLFLYDSHENTEHHVSASSVSDDEESLSTTIEKLIEELFESSTTEGAGQKLNNLLVNFSVVLDKNNPEDVQFVTQNIQLIDAYHSREYDQMHNIFVSGISRYIKQAVDMKSVFGAVKQYVAERTTYLSDEFRKDFDRRWNNAFAEDGRMNVESLIDQVFDTMVAHDVQSAQVANDYKTAQAELQNLDEQLQQSNAAAQTWTSRRDSLQRDIQRLEILVGNVSQQLSQAEDDRHALEVQAANILRTSSATAATSRLEQLDDTIRATETRQKTLAEELQQRSRALSDARSEMMLIQKDVQVANDQLAQLVERYTLKQKLLADAARQIDVVLKDYDAPSFDNVEPLSIDWFENMKRVLENFYKTKYEPQLRELIDLRDERDKLNDSIRETTTVQQDLEEKYNALRQDHETLKKRHEDLVISLTELYQRHADPEDQVANVQIALQQLDKKLTAFANAEEDVRFYKREFEAKEKQLRELMEAQAVTTTEIETLRKKEKETNTTFVNLSDMNNTLYAKNLTLAATIDELRQDLIRSQSAVDDDKGELENLRRELDEVTQEKINLEEKLALATTRIARLVTVETEDIDDTIASTLAELQRNREEITRLNESTVRLSTEKQAELDTRLSTQRQLENLQEQLEETKRDHESKVQEQRQTLEALKDRYRNVDKKYSEIVNRRDTVQRLITTDTLAAEKKSVRIRDLESQLAVEENKFQRAQETIEQQRRVIEQTQAALKLAQSAQAQISHQTNMKPGDFQNMQNVIGAIVREPGTPRDALRTLNEYLKKVPARVNTKDIGDIVQAARSTAENEFVENVDDIQKTYHSIVRTASSLSENRRPLMETTQRQQPQQRDMAATDDYDEDYSDDEEGPTFTHAPPPQPRITVSNTFSAASHPDVTALLEIEDSYGSFSEIMEVVSKEVGEFSTDVIDQFYSFTESVRGRVAAARSFWRKEHTGMKALVAHAIEASEKVRHSVFPIATTKQFNAFRASIYDFYNDMMKHNTPRDREEFNVGRFMTRIVSKLENEWPGIRFTVEEGEDIEGVTFEKKNTRNFLNDLTNATTAKLYVEQPGVSVTRASHLAVVKYIKSLLMSQAKSEIRTRARMLKDSHVRSGRRILTLLQPMVDSAFFAAMQVTFDAANVPMDFNNERFIKALYDPKMVDYVAAFYNQSFAQSRHSITAKRTTLFDLQISAIRETLRRYEPPGGQDSIRVKQEPQYSDEEEGEEAAGGGYQEYQGEEFIEDF